MASDHWEKKIAKGVNQQHSELRFFPTHRKKITLKMKHF
jgi:hypothetical protein